MRITDNMRFNTTVNSLFSTQSQYNDLLEKIASQKKVNRASDDPVAATKIIDIRQGKAANEQYRKNMDSCDSWISATESNLSSAYDLLVSAQMIAVGQATATSNAVTRQIAAQQVQSLIDEMSSLANAKSGNRYLFSGSQTSTQPFSSVLSAATIEQAQEAGGNTFTGTVTSSGTYTGTVNKTYAVKITADGVLKAGGAVITAATLIKDIDGYTGYAATDYIHLGGTDTNGNTVSDDTFTVLPTTTVGDLLTKINTTFATAGATVTATIDAAGKLMVVADPADPPGPGDSLPAVQISVKNFGGTADNTFRFDAAYQFSTDGGREWNRTDLSMSMAGGSVTFGDGDGVTLTFNDALGTQTLGTKAFGENDIFYVNAIAPGYYRGDSENLSMTINRGTNLTYNITGAEAFTSAGSNGVDVFATLYTLKDALNNNNVQGISGQLDNLKSAQNQVTLNQSRSGTKANHLEVVKNSLADFDTKLNDLLSVAQDADLADLITRLSMKEIALQASYSMAAKIRETTILNFLK